MSEPLPMENLQQEETVTPDVKTDVVERFEKKLMPHSHQSLNMFKSCFFKHSLFFFSS